MVQSMSSTTRMDRLVIPTRSLLSSALQLTSVSSRSYMSNLRWLAMAAIRLDLPVPGGPYSSFWSMASVSNVNGWWRSIGDHESEYSFMYILRILFWSFIALAVATMYGSHLLSFLHADNHVLRFVRAADTQARHVGVDACCKVAEARGQHVAHLIWRQLVHDAAHQHDRCCDGCCRGDGLLVGLDGLVVGRHGNCAPQVSSKRRNKVSALHPVPAGQLILEAYCFYSLYSFGFVNFHGPRWLNPICRIVCRADEGWLTSAADRHNGRQSRLKRAKCIQWLLTRLGKVRRLFLSWFGSRATKWNPCIVDWLC